jgi:hypothetical protein
MLVCEASDTAARASTVVRERPWFSPLTGDGLATLAPPAALEKLPNMATPVPLRVKYRLYIDEVGNSDLRASLNPNHRSM